MSEETQKEEALHKGPCVQIRGYCMPTGQKCARYYLFFLNEKKSAVAGTRLQYVQ